MALPISPGSHGGGKKGRSGRKPAAWKQACEAALIKAKAPEVLARIISGDILEELGRTKDGQPIYGETKNSDRIGAIKFAAAEAYGTPTQRVEVTGDDGSPFHVLVTHRIVDPGAR